MKHICSINGIITDQQEATLPLFQIEAQYGFGVYETIKVRNSIVYFIEQHVNRLFHSAQVISLEHAFQKKAICNYIHQFIEALEENSCNLKILLYGSGKSGDAQVIILASAPLYPQRKWYKEGVKLMSYQYERWMPQAKSLNMIASYYIYKKAQEKGCYDALLYDHNTFILEGTRTNVYLIKGNKIYSPPQEKILVGVTMMSLEKVIQKSDFKVKYRDISLKEIGNYEGMFISSTSSKIVPIKQIDNITFKTISPKIKELISLYDNSLEKSGGDFDLL